MVVLLRKNQLNDVSCETVMLFSNMVLCLTDEQYRFPKSVATFDIWCQSARPFSSSVKEYASCVTCHAIHPYSTEEEQAIVQQKVSCFDQGIFLGSSFCQQDLLERNQYGTLAPLRTFSYNSLVETLKMFFMRDGFANEISLWKERQVLPGMLSDIYDGQVWNEFKLKPTDNQPFVFQNDFNLLLTLNCDWFQAYKDSYSVGAIYLTVQNLPREIRNLRSNVILVCLINGPKEPKTFEMNHYLRPLVKELKQLMSGVEMETRNHGRQVVKAALSLCMMDLPAQRKVAGFTSFNSINACLKCKKQFDPIVAGDKARNFSDFNIESQVRRTCSEHRQQAQEWLQTRTESARKEKERQNGTRWSVLLDLPYFDPIRHVGIDIMHNLLLGLTKKMASIWTGVFTTAGRRSLPKLTPAHLKEMQIILESKFILPPSHAVSSIARKITIGNGFSNFKADEWATWLLVLSPYLLPQRLEKKPYEHWMLLVKASRILLSPCLSLLELDTAHDLLKSFLVGFEEIYHDKFLITINFHNALHLKETILDYSASPSHWLFNFERYNQDLKTIRTNRKGCVERTYIDKFLLDVHSEDSVRELMDFIPKENKEQVESFFLGDKSLASAYNNNDKTFDLLSFYDLYTGTVGAYGHEQLPLITVSSLKPKMSALNEEVFSCLISFYNSVHGDRYIDEFLTTANSSRIPVERKVLTYKYINIFGNKFNSIEASTLRKRGSYAMAYYPGIHGLVLRYCQIYCIFRSNVKVIDEDGIAVSRPHTLAYVKWFNKSNDALYYFNNQDPSMYGMETLNAGFEDDSDASIIPVVHLHSQVAVVLNHFTNRHVVIPLPPKLIA